MVFPIVKYGKKRTTWFFFRVVRSLPVNRFTQTDRCGFRTGCYERSFEKALASSILTLFWQRELEWVLSSLGSDWNVSPEEQCIPQATSEVSNSEYKIFFIRQKTVENPFEPGAFLVLTFVTVILHFLLSKGYFYRK